MPGIASKLESTPPSRRRSTLVEYLRIEVARILGLGDNHPIDEREPLTRLGLDSLMALEFRNTLAMAFERQLSATLLFDCPTLSALAGRLLEAEPGRDGAGRDGLLEEIAAMSDEEAERLLAEEMGSGR